MPQVEKANLKGFLFVIVLLCLVAAPALAQTLPQQIIIKREGAAIHIEPNAESRIIERPAVGSVYDVIGKADGWYKVKVPSPYGAALTGFVREQYTVAEEPVVEPKEMPQVPMEEAEEIPAPERKLSVSLGGLYHRQQGYSFELSFPHADETGTFYDRVGDTDMFGSRLGLAYSIREDIEVVLGFQYSFASLKGLYAIALPSDSLLADLAYAQAPADYAVREMVIDLGANYRILKRGLLRPYIGGGAAFIFAKVEMPKSFSTPDTYYPDKSHSIAISNTELSDEAVNAVGFYGRAGVDIAIADQVALFGEAQYVFAKKKIAHPFAVTVIGKDESLEIDLGGIAGIIGVKIEF